MKFLIIGASGYVGSHCYNYIKSQEYEVIGTQFKSNLPNLVKFDLSKDKVGDVIDKSFFKGKDKTFGIIFGGVSQVERAFKEKELSYKINVVNTIKLIKDLVDMDFKPVYFSSAAVFEGNIGYYNEESPREPKTEYGRQKLEVERFIEQNVPDAMIFRLDKVVGDDFSKRNLFFEWYNLMEKNQPILCLKDQIFCPTYNDDIAKAVLISCEKNLSGAFNLANTEIYPKKELVRQFAIAVGKKPQIILKSQHDFGYSEFRPVRSFVDTTKFIEATGFNFTPIRDVFEKFKEKLKSNK